MNNVMPPETPEQQLAPTLSADTPRASWAPRWAIIPLPLLALAIVVLWIAGLRVAWPSPPLNWFVHYGSVALEITCIVIPAACAFLANGQPSVLMLGCGMLMVNIGVVATALVLARGLNPYFALFNTSVLLASVCFFSGVAITSQCAIRLQRPVRWLAGFYAGGAAVMGLVILATLTGRMPLFFIDGQGGTLLRNLVVGASIVLYILTAVLLLRTNRRAASPFLYWYALGLLLAAIGMTGYLVIALKDSPLQWVTRFTQTLGAIYICVAVLTTVRERHGWGVSLAPVEGAWQCGELWEGARRQTPLGMLLRYGLAVMAVAAAMGLRLALSAWAGPGLPVFITFYPAVMVVALLAGLLPGMLATALSGAITVYWLLPSIGISPVDRLELALFTGMGLFMSVVAEYYHHYRNKAAGYASELALRESEARFHAAFAQGAVGMGTSTLDGQLLEINDAFCRMLGYTASELAMHSFAEITHPDDQPANLAGLQRISSGEAASFRMEKRYLHRDGHLVWVDMSTVAVRDAAGKPAYLVTHVVDITERKQGEETLRELTQRLTYHVDNSPLAVIEWGPDMNLTRWSGEAECLFGWQAEEVLGKRMEDFRWIYQEDEGQVAEVSGELRTGANPRRFSANRNYCKDGSVVHCEWYNSSLLDASGNMRSILSLVLDVTARTRAERERTITVDLLRMVTECKDLRELTQKVVTFFHEQSGCEAVGLRLRDGEDFPYFETRGFPPEFVQLENHLCARDVDGQLVRDQDGTPLLDCMCGNILCGWFDPVSSFFTENGSFCSNNTTALLTDTTETARQARTRNRCNGEGYESVALLPLRVGTERIGLLQLNDRRPGMFDSASITLWERLADHLAIGLAKLRAEEALRASEERERERAEELAVLLDAAPTPVFIAHDPDCLHLSGNRAADELLRNPRGAETSLSAPDEVKPRHFKAIKEGRELQLDELPAQRAARGEHVKDFEFSLVFDDGIVLELLGYGTPLLDEQGQPRGAVHVLVDITDRKHAEEALRESGRRVSEILESIRDGFFATDSAWRLTYVNQRAAEKLGLTPEAMVGQSIWEAFPHILGTIQETQYRKAMTERVPVVFELDGVLTPHSYEIRCFPTVEGISVYCLDTTERKQNEQTILASLREKDVLLKETHHRVKNNMQVISSLVSLQADSLDNPALRPLFNDLRDQVRTMALVHDKLYQSASLAQIDFAEYTRSLLDYLWRAHGEAAATVRLTLDTQPVALSVETAVPCGLILNELVTNALKHAFRDRVDGAVTVALHADPDGHVTLRVSDNGPGLPADQDWRHARSLGLHLVQMLTAQVRGTVEVSNDGGTTFTVGFNIT